MKTSKLLTSAAILPFLMAGTAMAQSQAAQNKPSYEDEIIVTAQKRSQKLGDVPMSITTVPKEKLDAMLDGGADIRALAARIPSVYVEGSSGRTAPRFYIRGLGNVDFDLQASQPVSIVMDDVVMENVLFKGFPLFDIAQTEVLRGPQGTLFGRNTPAGVIKFDTVKPTQETEGYMSASFGRFSSSKIEGALGGGLSNSLSARISFLYNFRDDNVENVNPNAAFAGNNDGEPDLGGFRDIAARAHLAFNPSGAFSSLLTLTYRNLDATTTLFRANILSPGSNNLNSNFIRNKVTFDGGRNNTSKVKTYGATMKNEYDFGTIKLTSITGYLDGNSSGIGDIDGGVGAAFLPTGSFPGFIPFPSETGSKGNQLHQFTQETRFSNSTPGKANWQIGGYYFEDKFFANSLAFNGFGNPAPTIQALTTQKSHAWAGFAQLSYDVSDALNITGGIRYSHDKKTLTGTRPLGFLGPINVFKKVKDNKVTYDLSANYRVNEQATLYTRYARGFRGPSIQGRIMFSNNVTTAKSETNDSYEAGFKTKFNDGRVRLNGSVFYYRVKNQQFTAIGGAGNFNQLINAKKGVGKGFELEGEFHPVDNLAFTAGVSYNNTEIKQKGLLVAFCGGGCTVLDPIVTVGSKQLANINGNPFPQAPEWIVTATARYAVPVEGGEIYAFTDWNWQGKTNFFLYQSTEFNSKGNFEGGLRIGYNNFNSGYDLAAFVRNITDENNLVGGIDFNNLTGFVNQPRIWGFEAKYKF